VINSRILISLASIATAGSLMAGATFALFTDSGTSNANAFSTGSITLNLSDNNETDQDDVTASFGGFLAPGNCVLFPQTLTIKNAGTIAANTVTLSASNSNGDFSKFLRIQSITFDGTPVVIAPANGNGFTDLDDLAGAVVTLPSSLAASSQKDLTMTVCLDSSVDNSFQGASDTLNLTITLNQI